MRDSQSEVVRLNPNFASFARYMDSLALEALVRSLAEVGEKRPENPVETFCLSLLARSAERK